MDKTFADMDADMDKQFADAFDTPSTPSAPSKPTTISTASAPAPSTPTAPTKPSSGTVTPTYADGAEHYGDAESDAYWADYDAQWDEY